MLWRESATHFRRHGQCRSFVRLIEICVLGRIFTNRTRRVRWFGIPGPLAKIRRGCRVWSRPCVGITSVPSVMVLPLPGAGANKYHLGSLSCLVQFSGEEHVCPRTGERRIKGRKRSTSEQPFRQSDCPMVVTANRLKNSPNSATAIY
jgi:hypothetical protein